MKIALIVGHDAERQGAVSNGISEWEFNDGFLNSIFWDNKLPDKHDYYILYRNTEISGYSAQMRDLHARIDTIGCELAIEFHLNDFYDKSVDGHECLVVSRNSFNIATKLNNMFTNRLSNTNRGVKMIGNSDNGYGFLSRGSYPCIIVEPFFISQIKDYIHGEDKRIQLEDAYTKFFELIE